MKVILIALALFATAPAMASEQTNKERGMLSYEQAFGANHSGCILLEFKAVKPNKMFEVGTIFLSSCDFKAPWAVRTRTENTDRQ